jgi:hypothetical protein
MTLTHPETGELLEGEEALRQALTAAEEQLSAHYRTVWALRNGLAEIAQPAPLPSRRNRTETQERIARCPRCGGRLEIKEGGAS